MAWHVGVAAALVATYALGHWVGYWYGRLSEAERQLELRRARLRAKGVI